MLHSGCVKRHQKFRDFVGLSMGLLREGSPKNRMNTGLLGSRSGEYGKGAGRVGDSYAPHGCIVHPAHTAHIASGSSTVLINGLQAARVGDPIDCGGSVASGSPDVIIGG